MFNLPKLSQVVTLCFGAGTARPFFSFYIWVAFLPHKYQKSTESSNARPMQCQFLTLHNARCIVYLSLVGQLPKNGKPENIRTLMVFISLMYVWQCLFNNSILSIGKQ